MTKRPCPFDYNLLPQMKIRVRQKDYDLKHENLLKIHDKTLQMLFAGAKLNGNNNKTNTIENKCVAKNVSEFCTNCSDLNIIENKCSFCDKWLCRNCCSICKRCNDIFCSAHSIKLYLSDESDYICLSCHVEEKCLEN